MKAAIMGTLLMLCIVALGTRAFVRPVGAEDDCADPTWKVTRVGPLLVCVGEGWQ